MMTILFLMLIGILIVGSIWYAGTIFNLFTILASPYFFIVFLNAYIASPFFHFYQISDEVLIMLMGGLISFFIGSIPFSKARQHSEQLSVNEKLEKYNTKAMTNMVLVIGILSLGRVLFSFSTGRINPSSFDETTGALGTGLFSHLNLMGCSVLPIVLLYGIKSRDKKALIGSLCILLAVFSTFVKYNIICLVASIAIFLALNNQNMAKKSLIIILVSSIALFLVNYYIGFAYRGISSNVPLSFYFNHLWAYIGGSTIYDNYLFTLGIREGVGIFEKLLTFIFAFPNMFINRLFGVKLFPHARQEPMFISETGVTSNVVDAIGYLYPSKGNVFDICVFLFVMCYIGMLFSAFVRLMLSHSKDRFNTTLPFFLSEFVLMSFFGTFYVNAGPWEQLLYCAILPNLFIVPEQGRVLQGDRRQFRNNSSGVIR